VALNHENSRRNTNLGPLMLDVAGLSLSGEEKKILSSPIVGGLILFTRNYHNVEQLQALIAEIRSVSPDIIIAVDHEGGRVQRFREGFTRIPPMAVLGKLYKEDRDAAIQLSLDCGWLMAAELIAYDIDISFAPILDRDYGVSSVIGDRAFSECVADIVVLTQAFIKGMSEAGMASTGKHFPGHGGVAADSHTHIPVDERSLEELRENDISVFSPVINSGLNAIMPAHIIYPKVDQFAAGFSKYWLQTILRNELKFDGVIFSDDLGMEGATVAGSFSERAEAALSAGCDMVLVCNNPEGAAQVLKYLEQGVREPNKRLNSMRLKPELKRLPNELPELLRWKTTCERLATLTH
jgi:beta-N-acetylhexosaminidase